MDQADLGTQGAEITATPQCIFNEGHQGHQHRHETKPEEIEGKFNIDESSTMENTARNQSSSASKQPVGVPCLQNQTSHGNMFRNKIQLMRSECCTHNLLQVNNATSHQALMKFLKESSPLTTSVHAVFLP
mmetsp:Transcript_31991/g.38713  ORF Transcript_31991/g.38713 Transcript_31991/m.38713 type:complete len:131 (+) Transcript_31991:262-654(+)